ncbi:MAG: FliH/SctL family protein [Planctomycetota bacterium]
MVEAAHSSPASASRIIRAPGSGLLLDEQHFRLEDIQQLTSALIERSEGRLGELERAATEIETRLRTQADDGRARLRLAIETAQRSIDEKIAAAQAHATQLEEAGFARGMARGEQRGFAQGYSEGLEKGLKEGRAQGDAAVRSELTAELSDATQSARSALDSLRTQLERQWQSSLAGARAELLDLALSIAHRIVRHHGDHCPEAIVEQLKLALDRIEVRGILIVEIHPLDREHIDRCLEQFLSRQLAGASVRIVENNAIGRGGCCVRTEQTTVDVTLETQLEVARRRLVEAGGVL